MRPISGTEGFFTAMGGDLSIAEVRGESSASRGGTASAAVLRVGGREEIASGASASSGMR